MVKREEYFNKLLKYKDKKLIKVITGIRRCGKSTLLKMFRDYLIENAVDEKQIIFINFEDLKNEELHNYKSLYNFLNDMITTNKMYYIMLDEIQNVDDFQKVIDSIYLKDNVDIYITGSNAYMLSSEIATLIAGRYLQIEMLPLSYKEYIEGTGKEPNADTFLSYLQNGSFPQILQFNEDIELINDYVENLFNTIVVKDILSRKKINDVFILKSILSFIIDNIGSTISTKKIADVLSSTGRKVDYKTVEKYLGTMIESYILYQTKRYDIKGKQYLKSQEKYYVVDISFKNMLMPNKRLEMGHILENIVYLELIRRGYKVYIGKANEYEIDFVATKGSEKEYIQVATTISDNEVYNREIRPLKIIKDNYDKIILTMDKVFDDNDDGIIVMNIEKWLLTVEAK